MSDIDPFTITIFGASGDLAKRKLFPAIFNLYRDGLLGEDFALLGYARSAMPDDDFPGFVCNALSQHAEGFDKNSETWKKFSQKLDYIRGSYDQPEGYLKLNQTIMEIEKKLGCEGNRVFHISTPPSVFDDVSMQLSQSGMAVCTTEGVCSRIIIEKPFGHDLESARELNRKLNKCFLEKQIYRIDHYLGKETVQNILMLRFANLLLESVWNNRYVDHVQITVSESLGIESRGSYYDTVGATRDMMQNHLMQLLCITAMEPPNNIDSNEVRDEKVKVLKALRPYDLEDLEKSAIRGQYCASRDGKLAAYIGEEGVAEDSNTETFIACKIHIDNWRWRGTPFYLRTGKRMAARYSEIYLQLKELPMKIFGNTDNLPADGILVRIQPDEGVTLHLKSKVPGANIQLESVNLDFDYSTTFEGRTPDAYERLLYDAILDKPALFIRSDETETAWQYFDPLLKYWSKQAATDSDYYPAGTNGPDAADRLMKLDGRQWRQPRKS